MKKWSLIFFALAFICAGAIAQSPEPGSDKLLYDPSEDAKAEIAKAVIAAEANDQHVLIQVGGNWCKWCLMFDDKVKSNDTLRLALEENFVIYHLNYSKENKNTDVLQSLDFPQRFGFPVFVILDGNGKRIHTQNSAYLEEGQGHSTKKVLDFFNSWSPSALDPSQYE